MLLSRSVRLLLTATFFAAGSHLLAASYDAVANFNSTSNLVTNTWQYGTSLSAGGAFTPFVLSGSSSSPAEKWWSATGNLAGPVVGYNASGGIVTIPAPGADIIWPNNVLLLGPGSPNTGTGDFVTVRFVAPSAGNFNISGAFSDLQQSSVNLYIEVGGAQDFSKSYSAASAHQGTLPFSLANIALTPGETVDFTVDSEGNQANDVVGLGAALTPASSSAVPEPGVAWLAGVGLLALAVLKLAVQPTTFEARKPRC